ncbi:uncharacterized protein N0V96_009916 [Colletotrichum fioriniae]|uniref:uncharacterized protein n=1 Tax=Colletotrichum fioriniae TaxID=710243 RepID=UPI0032DBE923|nr:hypothetical protein N0V96_009916 [Colletotrichum fioriniae]
MPEVRNDARFDSTKFLLQYWQAGIPGFEPYIALGTEILHNVIKWNLTPTGIAKLNKPLSDEANAALSDILTDDEVRAMLVEARQIIAPILEKRRVQKAADPSLEYHDALDWYETAAKRMSVDYDPADQQLALSISAILTSNDLMSQSIMDLCKNPEMFEPLRNEIRSVIGDGQWRPTSLYNTKLLDSVLKETLRLKPVAAVGLGRRVVEDVRLKDGTFLPQDSGIAINAGKMWDPKIYENPRTYDGYRFLRLREASEQGEKTSQLVSTSPEHLGFGLGIHACPGRFFGANTVKLVMCHLLLKYDIKLAENANTNPLEFGFSMLANPTTKVLVRRRKEDVNF